MDNWLLNRLSPVKDSDPRWAGLAKAIQQFWEENFDPLHYDLVNLRSIYTMSQPDLALKMREKGDYFSPDWPTEYDQPLAVAWREGEILRKSTEYILRSTFRRNFRGISVGWYPLYAPKIGDYGSLFITANSALVSGETLDDDYWLTSRGVVSVDLNSMYTAGSWTMETFSHVINRIVQKLKPLHIVYEGIVFEWTSNYSAGVYSDADSFANYQKINIDLKFGNRYDIARADDVNTDSDVSKLTITSKTNVLVELPVSIVNRGPFFDEVDLDAIDLDYDFWGVPEGVAFYDDEELGPPIPIKIINDKLNVRYLKIIA